jgi:tRNA dimethylallyltransferase
MPSHLPPLIVILGPTGSGKTGLSIDLAKRLKSEVISADSRQVYRELNIGTEKISARDMRGVPHHGINIASPRRALSVEQWRAHALRAISAIHKKGCVPILAGGTGLYIDALVYGIDFPAVKPNVTLRAELARKTAPELLAQLQELDPARAETIEQQNPRRLVRAIEIATALGKVPPSIEREPKYEVTWIGINPPFEVLEQRISERLDRALKKGLVAETKRLHEELHVSWKRINELGLEYRIVGAYLRGELTKQDLRETLIREVRRYAKRQLTWLKRYKEVTWYPSADEALVAYK